MKFIGKIANKTLNIIGVQEKIVNVLTNSGRARPSPFSLYTPKDHKDYENSVIDYTTWIGLAEKSHTKRHLPPASEKFINSLPPLEEVVALFKRGEDKRITPEKTSGENVSKETSVLFPFFAQWFTDSFLRTDGHDWHKNTSNHEIDLCQIYGLTEEATNALRSYTGGRLKSQMIQGEEHPPFLCEKNQKGKVVIKPEFSSMPNMKGILTAFSNRFAKNNHFTAEEIESRKLNFFVAGLNRGNSSIGYSVINAVFLRAHNKICDQLAGEYPNWDDNRLFHTARNALIVILLKIVVVDYIRHISGGIVRKLPRIGFVEKQKWCRPNWIAIEFALLYRWHVLLPDEIVANGDNLDFTKFMYNPEVVVNNGISSLVQAWSKQSAGASGLFNTPDFLMPAKLNSLTLSRQARLASYNDYREAFSMKRISSFAELNTTDASRDALKSLYNNDIDKLEFLPGLWCENRSGKGILNRLADYEPMFGESIMTMVGVDAFSQALTNPLLSENIYNADTFSKKGMEIMDSIETLEQLINWIIPSTKGTYISFRLPK